MFGMHGLRAEQVPAAPPPPVAPPPAAARSSAGGEFRVAARPARPGRHPRPVRAATSTSAGAPASRARPRSTPSGSWSSQQAERIRSEKGAKAVDFRLETKDGKVSLKARVVR